MAKNKSSSPSFAPEALQASADGALAALSQVEASQQADLVDAWVAAGNAAAVARIAGDESAPAAARKSARRGVNVLKSRGVSVPEKSTVARPLAQTQARQIEAWFVPFEAGAQGASITLLSQRAGSDTEMVDIQFNDDMGIIRANGGTVSGSRVREWEGERRRNRGYDPVVVPIEWARWRLGQARLQNSRSGLLLPLELDRYAHLIGAPPASDPGHPGLALGLEATNDPERVARSQSLFNEPEFRAFMLAGEILQEMLTHVGQRIASLGRQPEEQEITQFIEVEKRAATDRFFQDGVRRQLAAQMFDALPSVFQRAGRERALDLLAAREAVLSAGLITQPPSEIPFLVAFFDKTLAVYIQQNKGQLSIPLPRPNPGAGPVLSPEQLAAVEAARQG